MNAAAARPPRILVVEDEMMLVMLMEDMLGDLGCEVITAGRVAKALDLARTLALDGAILDVNVAGTTVYPVAEELRRRGIPFVFSTGYGSGGLNAEYRDQPTLDKPFAQKDLRRVIAGWGEPARPVSDITA